jgi:hypothetical protein
MKEKTETDHNCLVGINQALEGEKAQLEKDVKRLKEELI